ncbi:toxin [Geomobilimonas luticola]|uniref:Toxin n=1 Tax=Geomobilimonas luticola TaxID=1114878 RepID=A0ABS5S8R5_9BACT|nr:toxin [Geomobilimonas luticola]MBT0651772.1 toxin [Geomobilimonas luticola]
MKPINWNSDKNLALKTERGISFEEVLVAISQGALLDVVEHLNKEKYANQRIFIVRIRDYTFLVPFVETDGGIFLKTVIPSRSATKTYISKGKSNE